MTTELDEAAKRCDFLLARDAAIDFENMPVAAIKDLATIARAYIRELQQRETIVTNYEGKDGFALVDKAQYESLVRNAANGPRWKSLPDQPGLWVVFIGRDDFNVIVDSELEFDFYDKRVITSAFGPIPEPPQ